MAARGLSAAQVARKYARQQATPACIQSLLMQINADAVRLVRTQFQQVMRYTVCRLADCVPRVTRPFAHPSLTLDCPMPSAASFEWANFYMVHDGKLALYRQSGDSS
jgi:hypothetical protein